MKLVRYVRLRTAGIAGSGTAPHGAYAACLVRQEGLAFEKWSAATPRRLLMSAPGPGKLMLNLEQRGEYCVILEPAELMVAADKSFIERTESLLGRGVVQALD